MRPVDRDAVADRSAEQRIDRHAIGLAGHVEQRVLDRGDRLLVDAAARLARDDVQVLGDLFVASWVAADQHRRKAADHVRQADGAETFVELRPADDAVVGGDLEEGEHAPAGIGLESLDAFDLHAMPLKVHQTEDTHSGTKNVILPAAAFVPSSPARPHPFTASRKSREAGLTALASLTVVQNFETRVSFAVMNSSSAGLPALVCSMPRWIAALIWPGSVTRSP